MSRSSFFYRNSLSIVLIALMLCSLLGQFFTGWSVENKELAENGQKALTLTQYIYSGHFIQATFENWESEFLQMMLYVLLTISLRQKGSSESKSMEGKEDVDREPIVHPKAPWPVKKGGIWLKIYKHSLSLAFGILFLASFILHFYGSLKDFNNEQIMNDKPPVSTSQYLTESRFWFESFQNWQSEFLAVASLVILSIWFREKGSPESKPVDMPYDETP
ncbi:hypothetical protein MP478_09520 [Chryseobacterium sp. WG14]|uniref:DUF6766 family protein n=1 Tax=unclassified Chryseobacterium TaxID=2593645 RepID=UPI001D4C126A|nr:MULTISPECIES: DUF6766 family protein [unclassified Chryseobacterium]MCQ9633373.1 hypothetical protein [Chryseobacterium sp. WG23]MCQ9639631.1 hypothetical protein [Chryseobacterium sp. WG14]CAH0201522.1 hypothetical protein SRABI04_01993 [Chryseobacterium sp. Bi04]